MAGPSAGRTADESSALAELMQLNGRAYICSHCNRLFQAESAPASTRLRAGVEFLPTLCPACLAKLHPSSALLTHSIAGRTTKGTQYT